MYCFLYRTPLGSIEVAVGLPGKKFNFESCIHACSNRKRTARNPLIQVNLDMTDSLGPGKLVRHMQNPSYTYDKYLKCIGLGPSISSVICKNPSYSGPSYPSSPVLTSIFVCVIFHSV